MGILSLLSLTDSYYFTLMLLQKWDSWKGLYQESLTTDTATKLQGYQILHVYFTTEKGSTWHLVLYKNAQNQVYLNEKLLISWSRMLPPETLEQESWSFHYHHEIPSPLCTCFTTLLFLSVTCKDNASICVSGAFAKGETYLIIGFATKDPSWSMMLVIL